MAKYLLLLRHAKTKEGEPGLKDFDRKLLAEGVKDASITGRFLYKENWRMDKIFSSPAVRAQETAELIAEQIKFSTAKIQYEEELYEASVRTCLSVINKLSEDWQNVMIVGHNPTISYISEYLSQADIGHVKSCGLVILSLDKLKWEEVSAGNVDFIAYHHPAEMRQRLD